MKLRALRPASLLLALLVPVPAGAGVRRALLVGINDYSSITEQPGYILSEQTQLRLKAIHGRPSRKALDKLDGAVNDAEAMKEMLVQRFGFDENNVIVLLNQRATADNILKLLQVHLIDKARPGDISLFYFAGHGSRIRNQASREDNQRGLDSTLIPADALLGVPDIRSKELARIYAEAPKKGVMLTVIQDSCYSGAASRGAVAVRKTRTQPLDSAVSVDESLSGPLPEDSGVLIMTASQEYEPAAELLDTDLNGAHGAFTWALLRAFSASPTNERADRVFQRARALMQSKALMQEPVLLAKKGRNSRGLFGQPSDSGQMVTVAAGRVIGSVIKLNGGLAMNLHEGCELKRVAPDKPAAKIRITKVNGLGSSDAALSQPNDSERVQPGDLFALEKWVAPDRALLHVYVGKGPLRADLDRGIGALAALRKLKSVDWIEDPTVQTPTHRLSWDSSESKWVLTDLTTNTGRILIQSLTPTALERLLPRSARPRLFVQIPPAAEMVAALRLENMAADTTDAPEKADYVLLGRLSPTPSSVCAEYSWAVPNLSEDAMPKGRFSALPLRTDWFPGTAADAPAERLRNAITGLVRVAGWLSLAPPASDHAWPYELVLQNTQTKEILSGQEVRGGEQYKLMLRAMPGASLTGIPPRRVYVFVIDSFGRGTLVFGENLENEFPRIADNSAELIPLTSKNGDFTVGTPYGVDHYFLLASASPIDNPETIFNFSDVRTRGGQPADPLSRLLLSTGAATRGAITNVPLNWSIERLTLRCRPAALRVDRAADTK
jgi:hypothetical protein